MNMRMKACRALLLAACVVVVAATATVVNAQSISPESVPPGGTVVGNAIVYPDGSGIIIVPASIDSYNDCPSGKLCLWMSQDYLGSLIYTSQSSWYNIGSPYNNNAESARNNSAKYGQVATGTSGSGSRQCHNPGGHFASLGGVFNNTVSSYVLSPGD